MKKVNYFFYHILVSISILILAFMNTESFLSRLLILIIMVFLCIALKDHFYEIKDLEKEEYRNNIKLDYEGIKLLIGCSLASITTWYINNEMGYGPIIANGIVGVIAALLFPTKQAGAYYIASFIGMSSQVIVASMPMSGIIGLLAGFVIVYSQEVYEGIGGKGGTIAAFSTQLVRIVLNFFI